MEQMTRRAAGQRRVVLATAAIAGISVAGSVGLAVLVAHGTPGLADPVAAAPGATSAGDAVTPGTTSSGTDAWRPAGPGVSSGSSDRAPLATSGGS